VVLIIAMAALAYRRGKLRLSKCFERVYAREMDRLKQELSRGQWEQLPPTLEMDRLSRVMSQLQAELSAPPTIGTTDAGEAARRQNLMQKINLCREHYLALDLHRRMKL